MNHQLQPQPQPHQKTRFLFDSVKIGLPMPTDLPKSKLLDEITEWLQFHLGHSSISAKNAFYMNGINDFHYDESAIKIELKNVSTYLSNLHEASREDLQEWFEFQTEIKEEISEDNSIRDFSLSNASLFPEEIIFNISSTDPFHRVDTEFEAIHPTKAPVR